MTETIFEKALRFAAEAHKGQKRKDGGIYFLHPMEVACIIGSITQDEDVIAAGLLHDTVEDTSVTAAEILAEFGPHIAAPVACETEDKRADMPPAESWRIRKEESLEFLKNSEDPGAKILWLGDKLSNIRAISRDYDRVGDAVFERFNQKDKVQQKWYFESVLALLSELGDTAAYREFAAHIRKVFSDPD